MSLTIDGYNLNNIEGLTCILQSLPTSAVQPTVQTLPVIGGSILSRSAPKSTEWKFTVEVRGNSAADVVEIVDDLSKRLRPHDRIKGTSTIEFKVDPVADFTYTGYLAGEIRWTRDKQLWSDRILKDLTKQQGVCVLAGEFSIVLTNPYGVKPLQSYNLLITANTETSFHLREYAGEPTHPVFRFSGTIPPSGYLDIDGCRITGPVASGEEMILDFLNLEFYLQNKTTKAKIANIADRFINFIRLTITPSSRALLVTNSNSTGTLYFTSVERRL